MALASAVGQLGLQPPLPIRAVREWQGAAGRSTSLRAHAAARVVILPDWTFQRDRLSRPTSAASGPRRLPWFCTS